MADTKQPAPPPPTGRAAAPEWTVVPFGTHARFTLGTSVSWAEAKATLELARLAVESLFGPGRVALEARWRMDSSARTLTIDASTEVGEALALVFGGYAEREFGIDAVRGRICPGLLK